MRLKTQLAIQAHIEGLPPRAWSRKDFQELLAEKRNDWNAPQYLTPGRLITFLLDNDFARRIDIKSKDYGAKSRYITGDLSLLSFACSFYKRSYISHATALHVHGLLPEGTVYVNHEQTPKKTTSRLSQAGIDQAFKNQPRRSSYEFRTETHTFIFLNGKNTGDAGVVEITGPSGQPLRCTSLERTLIDCVVRPQYVGGISTLANALPTVISQISTQELVSLLAQTKYVYPYHQSVGFLLQRAGMSPTQLEPLRRLPRRFKFYLDYGMKRSLYDSEWQIYYPAELK
jgi:predicted transcriptional regulator of viral defense system